MKKYKNYDEIITDDGSTTLFSKLYNETCHSTTGAKDETYTHYIKGCEILNNSKTHSPICILEVGFGTGIGYLETAKSLKESKFIFVSFEIDVELIEIFSEKYEINFTKEKNIFSFKNQTHELYIILGNARETILKMPKELQLSYHAVYQDAFSPKRNAVLWTTEWFQKLKKLSHEDCIMSTYSASSSIRKSMIAAGWTIYNGEEFGKKRSSTRAKLNGTTEYEILDRLNRSPAPEITDENYKNYTLGN
ncbi:MAG: chorismate dehydratase [Bacteriovoracaceae bacterium]|jgi:tRNA U34 5-methylaminomethyl-2-thiouridine-forming methyltransferase MnmC